MATDTDPSTQRLLDRWRSAERAMQTATEMADSAKEAALVARRAADAADRTAEAAMASLEAARATADAAARGAADAAEAVGSADLEVVRRQRAVEAAIADEAAAGDRYHDGERAAHDRHNGN